MSTHLLLFLCSFFFFFNDPPTTEIYTLSLHDALPISATKTLPGNIVEERGKALCPRFSLDTDRKSTRLNSSHTVISYAVFCLKKKKVVLLAPPASRIRQRIHMMIVLGRNLPLSQAHRH